MPAAIAIIAEFNPFHTGHAYLLTTLRRHFGPHAALVVILSGSFVQRGEPALFSKWQRASMAVENGADCVVELPAVYALSSAAGFAAGGAGLAIRLGCTHLACGVEAGTAGDFPRLARIARECSASGHGRTAGQALTDAIAAAAPDLASLLQQPNALLALEYAKAITASGQELAFLPVPRQGSDHTSGLCGTYTSASALRHELTARGLTDQAAAYLPPNCQAAVKKLLASGAYTDYDRYGDFVLLQNRLLTPEKLATLPAFSEGLENRWYRMMSEALSYEAALAAVKTKRYAYSRLCRMGAYTLLQPSQSLMDASYSEGPQYGRILALNRRGAALIKEAATHFPMLNRVKDSRPALSPLGQAQLALDLRATEIQHYCFTARTARKGHADYYESPAFHPE